MFNTASGIAALATPGYPTVFAPSWRFTLLLWGFALLVVLVAAGIVDGLARWLLRLAGHRRARPRGSHQGDAS